MINRFPSFWIALSNKINNLFFSILNTLTIPRGILPVAYIVAGKRRVHDYHIKYTDVRIPIDIPRLCAFCFEVFQSRQWRNKLCEIGYAVIPCCCKQLQRPNVRFATGLRTMAHGEQIHLGIIHPRIAQRQVAGRQLYAMPVYVQAMKARLLP